MNRPEIQIIPSISITRRVIAVIDDLDQYLKHPEKIENHIHHVRVDIKKLRSWIRLVQSNSDKQEWQEIDRCLRDMAKQWSAKRDEEVISGTLVWLIKKEKSQDVAVSINRLYSIIQDNSVKQSADRNADKMPDRLFLDNLKRKTLSAAKYETVREGLQKTYKRALKLGEKACSEKGTVDDLHKFRRWVKYLCYQLEFIEAMYAENSGNIHNQMDKLGKRLGRIHDLVMIKNRIKHFPEKENFRKDKFETGMAADRKMNKLVKQTKQSFDSIFVLNSREFASGLQLF
jgi:CHAD domain-containing protein